MKGNIFVIFGWALVLWGVFICMCSIFPDATTTQITVMLVGILLFMFGDIILLVDAGIRGD